MTLLVPWAEMSQKDFLVYILDSGLLTQVYIYYISLNLSILYLYISNKTDLEEKLSFKRNNDLV